MSGPTGKFAFGIVLTLDEGAYPWFTKEQAEEYEYDDDRAIDIMLGTNDQDYVVRKAAREALGVSFIGYSYESSEHALIITKTLQRSSEGAATPIRALDYPSGQLLEWKVTLEEVAKKLNIPKDACREACWFFCVYWS